MVDLALSTMALATWSRIHRDRSGAIQAASKYHCLLRVAQEQIARVGVSALDAGVIDRCLLGVLLMGRYEGATHSSRGVSPKDSFGSLKSWSHHDGAMAILKIRRDNLSHVPASLITKYSRKGLIKSSLLRNLRLPDWMLDGTNFGEYDLELDFDRIMGPIVNLRHTFTTLLQQHALHITEVQELNEKARQLDEALQYWVAQFPSTWSYQQCTLSSSGPWPKMHIYSSTVYSYSKLGHAAVWSEYFAARMLINSLRLKILESIRPTVLTDVLYEEQRQECIIHLKAMADSLLCTIPFCLERFEVVDSPNPAIPQDTIMPNKDEDIKPYLANIVIWPLTIASSLTGLDASQRLWFRSELASLGRVTGVGILECAETQQWGTL